MWPDAKTFSGYDYPTRGNTQRSHFAIVQRNVPNVDAEPVSAYRGHPVLHRGPLCHRTLRIAYDARLPGNARPSNVSSKPVAHDLLNLAS